MLNLLWPIFIIISIIFSVIFGKIDYLNTAIFESIKNTTTLCIELLGTICFWNGIMNIATKTNFINVITKILEPLNKFLFPKLNKNEKAYKIITMNMASNMLGLGNAATPLGINAMKELQDKNSKKNELTDEMKMFIVINTASIQIIPTTVIAIRMSLNSIKATNIIVPIWIASIMAFLTVIITTKIFIKLKK